MNTRTRMTASVIAATLVAATGCVSNATSTDVIDVSSTDNACIVTPGSAPAGTVTFRVTNNGADVTEVYVYAADGVRVVSELENIGAGLTRDLVTRLDEGNYVLACKPGMIGDGIRSTFTVTEGADGAVTNSDAGEFDREAAEAAAIDMYLDYVREEAEELLEETELFGSAYLAGRDDEARSLYPLARAHWERIEPVAESFGDIDPLIDIREADLLLGEEFTGWHRIEKDLWLPEGAAALTEAEREQVMAGLVGNTETLVARVNDDSFTIETFQIGNGAKELLDEVASTKMTGEEEAWSHTDVWDIEANIQGAQVAFWALEQLAERTDPALVSELEERFEAVLAALEALERTDGTFPTIDELTDATLIDLTHVLDALAEPLSRLTAAVVA